MSSYAYRKARREDLKTIISLLLEDELGKTREILSDAIDARYIQAFNKINRDDNQYLMVVEREGEMVGTCHLSIMPSLTFTGSTRMQIEGVRIAKKSRGQKVGEWMMRRAIEYGKQRGVTIVQLTTHKQRDRAMKFYLQLGFDASHEGMKLILKN